MVTFREIKPLHGDSLAPGLVGTALITVYARILTYIKWLQTYRAFLCGPRSWLRFFSFHLCAFVCPPFVNVQRWLDNTAGSPKAYIAATTRLRTGLGLRHVKRRRLREKSQQILQRAGSAVVGTPSHHTTSQEHNAI